MLFMTGLMLKFAYQPVPGKAGGMVIPRAPDEDPQGRGDSVESIPNLILRELVVAGRRKKLCRHRKRQIPSKEYSRHLGRQIGMG
jgi:hypothetical protein